MPPEFKTLRECAEIQNTRLDGPVPPGENTESWYNGLKNFAADYNVDIYNMSKRDMALINDRLEYWGV